MNIYRIPRYGHSVWMVAGDNNECIILWSSFPGQINCLCKFDRFVQCTCGNAIVMAVINTAAWQRKLLKIKTILIKKLLIIQQEAFFLIIIEQVSHRQLAVRVIPIAFHRSFTYNSIKHCIVNSYLLINSYSHDVLQLPLIFHYIPSTNRKYPLRSFSRISNDLATISSSVGFSPGVDNIWYGMWFVSNNPRT